MKKTQTRNAARQKQMDRPENRRGDKCAGLVAE